MISEKLRNQLERSAALLPPPLGATRRVETTEGPVMMTMADDGLRLEAVEAPIASGWPVPWQFGRVVVINRPDRADRKLALLTHLREIGWPFREPEWHVAAPGNQLPPPPPDWHSTRNIWAGNKSHCQIIREAYAAGCESVLIMEDDCLYLPDFLARVSTFLRAVPNEPSSIQ